MLQIQNLLYAKHNYSWHSSPLCAAALIHTEQGPDYSRKNGVLFAGDVSHKPA